MVQPLRSVQASKVRKNLLGIVSGARKGALSSSCEDGVRLRVHTYMHTKNLYADGHTSLRSFSKNSVRF